ncbi:MAG: DUF4492 domain-containing protein [Bacteroidales bacterium]|nr:DUF4492 domain-containing protein [Bacteroidales bacterium]
MKYVSRILKEIYCFYYDGFRNMSWWGKKIWLIIIIKVIIIFFVLRVFFFPDFLKKNFDDDNQRSDFVLDQITTLSDIND